jgi:outer membrane murein-binding lipoprotein Lpp
MIIFKLLPPILIGATSLIGLALQEKWWHCHDRRTKLHKWVVRVLFCLMLLGTTVAALIILQDAAQSSELVSDINTLLAENQQLSQQVELKTTQIVALSEAAAKSSQNTLDSITGGGSYCWFFYGFPGEPFRAGNTALCMLMQEGQFPLRDLRIQIWDLLKKTPRDIYRPTFFIPKQGLGDCIAESVQLPADQDCQSFEIMYSAVNGSWHEQATFRRVSQKWQIAIRVTKDEGRTILHEQVDPNFPRDDAGHVMW